MSEPRVIWEFRADPRRAERLARRRRRWGIAGVAAAAVTIAAVAAFGVFGLVYTGVVLVVAATVIEAPTIFARLERAQRITSDGAQLAFEGNSGRAADPVRIADITRFAVYPTGGGRDPGSGAWVTNRAVDLWLTDGGRRIVLFRLRTAEERIRWAGATEHHRLVAALSELMPGRRRDAPGDGELPRGIGHVETELLRHWESEGAG